MHGKSPELDNFVFASSLGFDPRQIYGQAVARKAVSRPSISFGLSHWDLQLTCPIWIPFKRAVCQGLCKKDRLDAKALAGFMVILGLGSDEISSSDEYNTDIAY